MLTAKWKYFLLNNFKTLSKFAPFHFLACSEFWLTEDRMFQENNFQTNPKIIVIFFNKLKNEAYSKYNQGAYSSNKSKACKRNAQGDRLVSVFGVVSAFLFTFNFSFQKNDLKLSSINLWILLLSQTLWKIDFRHRR